MSLVKPLSIGQIFLEFLLKEAWCNKKMLETLLDTHDETKRWSSKPYLIHMMRQNEGIQNLCWDTWCNKRWSSKPYLTHMMLLKYGLLPPLILLFFLIFFHFFLFVVLKFIFSSHWYCTCYTSHMDFSNVYMVYDTFFP